MILCDTNIIIEATRQREPVLSAFELLLPDRVALSVVTVAEIIRGARNQLELQTLLRRMTQLEILHVSESISRLSIELMTRYRLSHHLDFADALIAATALEHGLPLFTLNRKDFCYLPGIHLYEP